MHSYRVVIIVNPALPDHIIRNIRPIERHGIKIATRKAEEYKRSCLTENYVDDRVTGQRL